jgi:hypothetical protein
MTLLAEREHDWLPALLPLDLDGLHLAVNRIAAVIDDLVDKPDPDRPSELWLSPTIGGRGELKGSFDPLATATIDRAIGMAAAYPEDDERSAAQRRADALLVVCDQFLRSSDSSSSVRNRPHVSVIVDLPTLEAQGRISLPDGAVLDGPTSRQILCDCDITRVVTDGAGVVLDLGHTQRLVDRHQWHALVVRDGGCRYDGCDRPPRWTHAHHVIPWEHGGPTDLSNLVLLCSRHHHRIHERGWHDKLLPDGTYEVTTASGAVLTSHPPP